MVHIPKLDIPKAYPGHGNKVEDPVLQPICFEGDIPPRQLPSVVQNTETREDMVSSLVGCDPFLSEQLLWNSTTMRFHRGSFRLSWRIFRNQHSFCIYLDSIYAWRQVDFLSTSWCMSIKKYYELSKWITILYFPNLSRRKISGWINRISIFSCLQDDRYHRQCMFSRHTIDMKWKLKSRKFKSM